MTIPITEPIKLFDAYVENASLNVGYGAESSTAQLTIVYEQDGPKRSSDFTDNFPLLGTCVGIKIGEAEFSGIFQRYSNKRSLSGYKWDIVLESPAKLLDGIQVILDGFQGTAFTGANVYNPGADTQFTNQMNNVWNPFAIRENYDYGGIYGGSNLSAGGFPGVDLLELIQDISKGVYAFGGKAVFGETSFEVDLTELIGVLKAIPNWELFRIKGPVQSLNAIIQECCDIICYDYVVTVKPKSGSVTTNGVVDNAVIKIKMIDKTAPFNPETIKTMVDSYERQGLLIDADTGKELSDAVTQRLVIGGPATRYYTSATLTQIWGKTNDLAPRYVDYIVLDDGNPYYASITEIRAAMGSFDTWILYHLIQKYKGKLNPMIAALGQQLFTTVRLDDYTMKKIIDGTIKMNELIDTTNKVYDERAKLYKGETVKDKLAKIHNAVENAGREYWCKKYFVPLPYEAGGIGNNIKFIQEDKEYITSWELVDSAYSEDIGFADVSFYDGDGKLKATAVWPFDAIKGDYTAISDSHSFGYGGIAANINVEKDIYWIDLFPYAVIDIPGINNFDQYTTEENGLYWLLNTELGLGLDILGRMAGFGSDGTTLSFAIAPMRVTPTFVGIPQQSSRYSWGPWWSWRSLKGKAEVVIETSLSPETYGGYLNTNQAGFAYAYVHNAEIAGVESGFISVAELPIGNIGDRFAVSGPYVTSMDIAVGIDGIKTSYKFNSWTPQFGKIAKYNVDRISRLYKANIKFLQEQRSLLQNVPFKQPKPDFPIQKIKSAPNLGFMAGLICSFVAKGNKKNINIQGQHPNKAMGPASVDFPNTYGCTNEQLMSPVVVKKTLEDTNNDKPALLKPKTVTGGTGRFTGNHIGPTSKDLNPYFTHTETDFQIAVHGDQMAKSLDLQENKADLTEIRTMGFKGPMLYSAWGSNLDGSVVPAKATSGNDKFSYDTDAGSDRSKWPTGPIDLKWDEERKVYSGGPEIVEGILTSDITAPTSVDSPTTFTVSLRRTKEWQNYFSEEIKCINRDPSLKVTNTSGKILIIAIRINYEWRPLWVGCPNLI